MKHLLFILSILTLLSCSKQEITISHSASTKEGNHATIELQKYLTQMYPDKHFTVGDKNTDIQLILTEQARELGIESLPIKKESYLIKNIDGKLYIIAPDGRGLLNATYSLLEKQGCGFYISGDVLPEPKKWTGFADWEQEDEPVIGDRFLFNWHNFLSGCTGWNLEDWQKWIDQANKMRYNGVMVHAYGNNPMFSFEYLNEKKQTGYLTNSSSGRDWGAQHINDVRRMVGGEIYDAPILGAKASLASVENKDREATALMQQVFQYAEYRGTNVIFALDFDTWPANPQNIIAKLPKDAVFELKGHLTPNPEHPEGYKYYKQILKSLIETYPQVDELAVWHRRAGVITSLGSIWMEFSYEQFPEEWKKQYQQILKSHPEVDDNLAASSLFAFNKVIVALQKARDEIKPELKISNGSWSFKYIPYADVFFPKDVALIPLDYKVIFNQESTQKMIADIGQNRDVSPVIWAHHDDHRYIGRPYTPWDNLADKLKESNANGFGIIHWTTHPLDLYFTSSARQVWKNSKNEPLKTTVDNYVQKFIGAKSKKLSDYYYQWITEGPMFGRETTDHFMDLGGQKQGHKIKDWGQLAQEAKARFELLSGDPAVAKSDYLTYQKTMEEFYMLFFKNQQIFEKAYNLLNNKEHSKAIEVMQQANPDEAIQKYVDATRLIGFSSGERAIVFSMNTRWKADFINLRQRLGLDPVRFKFSPTQHDPLAQQPGRYTYFINENRNWYRSLWSHELKNETFKTVKDENYLQVNDQFNFKITSWHGQELNSDYEVEVVLNNQGKKEIARVKNNSKKAFGTNNELSLECSNDMLTISTGERNLKILEIVVTPLKK